MSQKIKQLPRIESVANLEKAVPGLCTLPRLAVSFISHPRLGCNLTVQSFHSEAKTWIWRTVLKSGKSLDIRLKWWVVQINQYLIRSKTLYFAG